MILNLLLVVLGFVLLMKGADIFVEASSKIAMKFNVPQIVIGLTIVAFGTSAPEAAVSLTAAIKGSAGISVGNIYGSNILNVLLVLGIASLFSVLHIKETTIKYEMPLVIGASVMMALLGIKGNMLSRLDGILFWIVMAGFFVYLIKLAKTQENEEEEELTEKDTMPRLLLLVVLGLVGIILGSDFTVDGATGVAKAVGLSDRIIGLTIVAFGTSLPELITSVIASRKQKADIAVGNIIGSNLFNILAVIGTVSIIHPIPYDSAFYFDSVITILAVVLLFLLTFRKKALDKKSGIVLLVCYAVYFIKLLV